MILDDREIRRSSAPFRPFLYALRRDVILDIAKWVTVGLVVLFLYARRRDVILDIAKWVTVGPVVLFLYAPSA